MTAVVAFTAHNTLVECINECGNETHPSVPECADCMDDVFTTQNRNIRDIALTRRFFLNS